MVFKNEEHHLLYLEMVELSSYKSAMYVLSAVGKRELLDYVDEGIKVEETLRDLALSDGEKVLVEVAASLCNGYNVNLCELNRLDDDNLLVVSEGIKNLNEL